MQVARLFLILPIGNDYLQALLSGGKRWEAGMSSLVLLFLDQDTPTLSFIPPPIKFVNP